MFPHSGFGCSFSLRAATGPSLRLPSLRRRRAYCTAPPSELTVLRRRFGCAAFTAPPLTPPMLRHRRSRPYWAAAYSAPPLLRRRCRRRCAAVGTDRAAPLPELTILLRRFRCAALTAPPVSPPTLLHRRGRPYWAAASDAPPSLRRRCRRRCRVAVGRNLPPQLQCFAAAAAAAAPPSGPPVLRRRFRCAAVAAPPPPPMPASRFRLFQLRLPSSPCVVARRCSAARAYALIHLRFGRVPHYCFTTIGSAGNLL